ncbi:MAG: hypothetical protein LBJ96_02610 [Holosporaceae bacterium]|jgi:hypothetical protein|nr:hypothetical protein [Holosporaceae bacterium]
MRRAKADPSLKIPITCSMLLHLTVLALMWIPSFSPERNDMTFADVQIIGEGELQDVLNNYQTAPVVEIVPREEPKEEPEPKVEPEPQPKEEVKPESTPTPEPEPIEESPSPSPESQPTPTELHEEDEIVFEELPRSEDPPPVEEPQQPPEEPQKDEKIEEQVESVPKTEEKPPEKIPEVKKPPKKKHRRKILRDVIKRAEKKKNREKNRQKILEIAEKADKEKKNADQKKKNDSAFDKMLNSSINDLKKTSGKGKKGTGVGEFGSGESLTEADFEIISSQIYPHWVVPSGVRDAENIVIEIEVQLRDSGEIVQSGVKILDERRYASDYVFRAAADSARRAILETGTLKIPRDKMSLFKKFVLRFNLKEALGG